MALKQKRETPLSFPDEPVDNVRWVHIDNVEANDYNPNAVATNEMRLLHLSIEHDGYTQPCVTIEDKRCEITLPCGHTTFLSDKTNNQLWNIIKNSLKELSVIPLDSLTEKVALQTLKKGIVDTGSKSHKHIVTTGANSANGSKKHGGSEESTMHTDSATSQSGTLQESTILDTSSPFVCPSCESNEKEQKLSWNFYKISTGGGDLKLLGLGEADGLIVKCHTSNKLAGRGKQKRLQSISIGANVQSDQNVENSDYQGIIGENILVKDKTKLIIVDGFHRYYVMKTFKDIYARTQGHLPIVVIDKPIADRMASTIRHNRARGKHSVAGMANVVFKMLDEGWSDENICSELGMEPDELIRLKHITGFSKLFENTEYRKAWESKRQIEQRREHNAKTKA